MLLFTGRRPPIVAQALIALCGLRVLVFQIGFDHLTTLEPWSNPICAVAGVTAGLAFAWFLGSAWLLQTSRPGALPWIVKLRHDDYLLWSLLGSGVAIGFSILAAWMCVSLLAVGAQYLGGSQGSFAATVISDTAFNSTRSACRRRLEVMRSTDATKLTICLATMRTSSLSAGISSRNP